jgi:PAS domain S-box-containing protein
VNPAVWKQFGALDGQPVETIAARFEVYRGDGSPRPPEEAPPLRALHGETISEEEEIVRTAATGELRHRLVSGAPVRDGDGAIIGSVCVVRDVTESKRAEQALRESEERFRGLFEGHTAAMLLIEPDSGQILDANAEAARFYGYSREQLQAMRIQQINQLSPEEVAAQRRKAVDRSMSEFVFPHRLAGGEVRFVEVYSSPVTIQGRLTLFSIIHDVTERKLAEEALRDSETRFGSLFQSSPDAVFLTMPDGTILAANPAACGLFGWSEDELREKGRSVLFEAGDPRLADVLEERRRTRRLRGVELLAVRKNGERFPIELDSVILPGEPERAFVIVRDITKRKLAEEALRESEAERAAQQERGRLARDLNDSVTQALFAATLKAEALTECGDSAQLEALSDDVRRLSRGALAQMRTLLLELRGDPVEAIPLPQLLRNVVEAAESRASVQVTLTLSEESALPPKVHEAVYRITQEALNTVVRHAKASNAWVEIDIEPSHARLLVGDDGRGFDPASVDPSHFGLRSMRERAGFSGGDLSLRSAAGEGTVLTAVWRFAESAGLD